MWLYQVGIYLFETVLRIGQWIHPKARLLSQFRRESKATLSQISQDPRPKVWMHVASAGEYEQGKAVISGIKSTYPNLAIVVTFFSPSGLLIPSDDLADYRLLYGGDKSPTAKTYVQGIKPSLFILVKNELWFNLLNQLQNEGIPAIWISATIKENHLLTKPMAGSFRQIIKRAFSRVFTLDQTSLDKLIKLDLTNASTGGDSRVDSTLVNVDNIPDSIKSKAFLVIKKPCIVYGSIWKDDWEVVKVFIKNRNDICHVIVPHEDTFTNDQLQYELGRNVAAWSDLKGGSDLILVDQKGILKYLYHWAEVVYIGGGFHHGLHNTLEPAVFGKAIITGNKTGNFPEVALLNQSGLLTQIADAAAFEVAVEYALQSDKSIFAEASEAFFNHQSGASAMVLDWIHDSKLLNAKTT